MTSIAWQNLERLIDQLYTKDVPDAIFSITMQQADLVIKATLLLNVLLDRGFRVDFKQSKGSGGYECVLEYQSKGVRTVADTPIEALCLAAIHWKGVHEGKTES